MGADSCAPLPFPFNIRLAHGAWFPFVASLLRCLVFALVNTTLRLGVPKLGLVPRGAWKDTLSAGGRAGGRPS